MRTNINFTELTVRNMLEMSSCEDKADLMADVAIRWANAMERRLARGEQLSRQMVGAALAEDPDSLDLTEQDIRALQDILAVVWIYGDRLKSVIDDELRTRSLLAGLASFNPSSLKLLIATVAIACVLSWAFCWSHLDDWPPVKAMVASGSIAVMLLLLEWQALKVIRLLARNAYQARYR